MLGPLLEPDDPGFLRWANLRVVLALGLLVGVLNGTWDAATHGWAGVRVPWMVFTTLWVPLVLVGLHLHLRRGHRRGRS